MNHKSNIGVLAFQGDVVEHIRATEEAIKKLQLPLSVISVRTKEEVESCFGLIIPGGESTTLDKLCRRENMYPAMKNLRGIFGTCAGAILLAKNILHKAKKQQTLGLMDISVDRNAYGRQLESFEKKISSELGSIDAIFIRAPQIKSIGKNITVLAKDGKQIIACEQTTKQHFYMALCFHPELTTTLFHEYFLRKLMMSKN